MANVDNNMLQQVSKGWQRILIGALGGLAAIAVKYLSDDHAKVLGIVEAYSQQAIPNLDGLDKYIIGYIIFAPITVFLGAIIGWISDETIRIKLFAIGVSAPALLTTWANPPAQAPDTPRAKQGDITFSVPSLVSSAWACCGAGQLFVVQVGAFAEPERAQQLIDLINDDPQLRAFSITEGDNLTRVWVTRLLSLEEALEVRKRLLGSGVVSEANVIDISLRD